MEALPVPINLRRLLHAPTAPQHLLMWDPVMVVHELPITSHLLLSMVAPLVLCLPQLLTFAPTAPQHLLMWDPVMVAHELPIT